MGAGRGIIYGDGLSKAMFTSIIRKNRFSILSLTIGRFVSHNVEELPPTLRQLKILADEYDYPLRLPDNLEELLFALHCKYDRPLVLPRALRMLVLGRAYNQPIIFPPGLLELELGIGFRQSLCLPPRLKRLAFAPFTSWDLPIVLPDSLVSIKFGVKYNQPTTLPPILEEIRVGSFFNPQDLSFPSSVRKIGWYSRSPIHIPEGVSEITFGILFQQPVMLPSSLKRVTFAGGVTYPHPVNLPAGVEELGWYPRYHDDFILPVGLQKLTWASPRNVNLPLGLKELIVRRDAPVLVLPEGLSKITFDYDYECKRHYELPESVHEVICRGDTTFTHASTLQHLILRCLPLDVDLYISIVDVDRFHDYCSTRCVDLSHIKVSKLTIANCSVRIKQWPQGLKEVAFTVKGMKYPLRVPEGCRIIEEQRPRMLGRSRPLKLLVIHAETIVLVALLVFLFVLWRCPSVSIYSGRMISSLIQLLLRISNSIWAMYEG